MKLWGQTERPTGSYGVIQRGPHEAMESDREALRKLWSQTERP